MARHRPAIKLTPEERAWRVAVLWGYIDTWPLVSGGDCDRDYMTREAYDLAVRCAKELEGDWWGDRLRSAASRSAICSTRGSQTRTPAGRSCAA